MSNCLQSIVAFEYLNSENRLIGSGTGFLCGDYIVTNNHVFAARDFTLAHLRCSNIQHSFTSQDFRNLLVAGSDENNKDFAILRKPHSFAKLPNLNIKAPSSLAISDPVHYYGYPFGLRELCFHKGYVSSIYESNGVEKFRIDGSVNHGNSGGPLIDPKDGHVIGLITRKETGLTEALDSLQIAATQNHELFQAIAAQGNMRVFGVSVPGALDALQLQITQAILEIRRSANVGIGIAFSSKYVLEELVALRSF